MGNFVCSRCGYGFESQSDSYGRKCPFCGEGKVKPEQDASSLLGELDNKNE